MQEDALPSNSSIVITMIFKEFQYIKAEIHILNSLNFGEPRHRKVENTNAESWWELVKIQQVNMILQGMRV